MGGILFIITLLSDYLLLKHSFSRFRAQNYEKYPILGTFLGQYKLFLPKKVIFFAFLFVF